MKDFIYYLWFPGTIISGVIMGITSIHDEQHLIFHISLALFFILPISALCMFISDVKNRLTAKRIASPITSSELETIVNSVFNKSASLYTIKRSEIKVYKNASIKCYHSSTFPYNNNYCIENNACHSLSVSSIFRRDLSEQECTTIANMLKLRHMNKGEIINDTGLYTLDGEYESVFRSIYYTLTPVELVMLR